MALDINQLMQDPQFQFGMGLMGASRTPNPIGGAMQQMLAVQEALRQKQMQEAQIGRLGAQTQMEQQQLAMAQQQMTRQNAIFDMLKNSPSFAGALGAQQQVPQPQMTPTEQPTQPAPLQEGAPAQIPQQPMAGSTITNTPTGKYGTPTALLDRLSQTESSGNPRAVNPKSGAMGAYQFMPSTIAMLAKQGIKFNPFDATQSRDAADQYIQMLLKENGGDYAKAMAAYGGFKTQDPSGYLAKVLPAALPVQQPAVAGIAAAQPTQAPQTNGMGPSPGLDLARLGALAEIGGLKGGSGLLELGKQMQPQPSAAGSYLRDPITGQMTFVPNPYEAQANAYKYGPSSVAGMSPQDKSQMTQRVFQNTAKSLEDQYLKYQPLQQTLMSLTVAENNAKNLGPFQGSMGEKKLEAYKFLNNAVLAPMGMQGLLPENVKAAELTRSQLSLIAAQMIKQIDPNPNLLQQQMLARSLGELGTDPAALPRMIELLKQTADKRITMHNNQFGQAKAAGVPLPIDLTLKTSGQIAQEMQQQTQAAGGLPAGWSVKVH